MIRKLPRYVLRELLASLVLALVLILLMLIAGLSVQLVYQGLTVSQLGRLIPFLALLALPHTLPAALLTSSVMTFGRLSGDNEITAIRSSGVHLHVVVTPAIAVGLVATIIGLGLNFDTLPKAYFKIDRLKMSAAQELAQSIIRSRGELNVSRYQIRANGVDGTKLTGVTILEYESEIVRRIWSAKEAVIRYDPETSMLSVLLRHGQLRQMGDSEGARTQTIEFSDIWFPVEDQRLAEKRPRHFKQMHMRLLLEQRAKCAKILARMPQRFKDPKKVKKAAYEEQCQFHRERNVVLARKSSVANQVKNIDRKISALAIRASSAAGANAAQRQAISSAEALLSKAKRELKALGRELTTEAQERRVVLKNRMRKYGRDIEKATMRVEEARKEARECRREIARLRGLRRGLVAKRDQLAKEAEVIQGKGSQMAARLKDAKAQLDMVEINTEIQQRAATAFSCLTFVLIGVPLGLLVKRGNILVGFAVSFMVVLLIYYPLSLGGQVLIFDKYYPVGPSVWAGNAVLAAIGVCLLAKVFRR